MAFTAFKGCLNGKSGRVHTSAAVAVMPEAEEVDLNESADVKMETAEVAVQADRMLDRWKPK